MTCESSVRTSAPALPSGRSAASTSKKVLEPTRIISPATRVVSESACSPTKMTSTSLT
ncbi:Uncharacterised protein [Mycobacteroides abscessus subsp. abscessus]|nr:Uncharacterised protein [Mycobacteroides abscessus subsp. abscessus]SKU47099.1 Uncharacterised protein [Mycobacteroides abscessus subsp. abscessus]